MTVGGPLWPLAAPRPKAVSAPTNTNAPVATTNVVISPVLFDAMRALDQQFIPLLGALAGSNAAPAQAAAESVLAAWPAFTQRCTEACPDDPRLSESLQGAEQGLRQGTALLTANKLEAARVEFHAVRMTLMQLRARLGVEYLPDYLTRYAQPLDVALAQATKLTPTNSTRADFMGVRDLCVAVRGYWLQFLGAPRIDAARYGFTPAQIAELQAAVLECNAAMKALETAFEGGDPQAMLTTLNGLKPPYLRVLAVFGAAPPEPPAGQ